MTQLEEAKRLYKTANADQRYVLESLFPELKESEDEKIRKELIKGISKTRPNTPFLDTNITREEAIDWLEKQGQKETTYDKEMLGAIEYCKKNNRPLEKEHIAWLEKQGKETSWKPSKEEMDVLYGLAYITNQYDEHKEDVITRLYQDLKREFFNGSSYENMFPNTEDGVRRRSTIQVLEYARSLDTYNQYGKADIDKNIAWLEKQGGQKPAWSEEDEKMLADACIMLDWYKGNNWWTAQYIKNWLKSLKQRYTWKPSDEQMKALWEAYKGGEEQAALASLYSDLKKLKGE